MMSVIYLGGDVSKGYLDVCFLNSTDTKLAGSGRLDDTATGHALLRQRLEEFRTRDPECRFEVGVEATGGLERNWLRFFAEYLQPSDQLFRLNPLAVKQFRARELHQNGTDAASAREIALYLRSGKRRGDLPYVPQDEGALVCCRLIQQQTERLGALKNQLQILLVTAHPELVRYCRGQLPQWVLAVLAHYPTAAALARARTATVARIPYVSATRATEIVTAAQASVAALTDPAAGQAVSFLVREVRHLEQQIDRLKASLCRQYEHDPLLDRWCTLPGYGRWTAVLFRLELGDLRRFSSANKLIAFVGLDPRVFTSGDGTHRLGISKRGRSAVRAALYLCVLRALRQPGPLKKYYAHLRARGKTHAVAMTAAMAKLLRWAYACMRGEVDFDATRYGQEDAELELEAEVEAEIAAAEPSAPAAAPDRVAVLVDAPVSRREAQRRRAAPTPQASQARRERGRGDHPKLIMSETAPPDN